MKRALVAALAASLATAAVLSASGLGATTPRKGKTRSAHRAHSGATGATGAQGAAPTGPPPTMAKALADMQVLRDAQDKKLADALGVSVEKLRGAFDDLEAKRLADAVKNNTLTQAEVDAIKACKKAPLTCDRSNLPAGGHGGHGGPGGIHFDDGDGPHGAPGQGGQNTFLTDLATALGVTPEKLKAALAANRPHFGGGRGGHDGGGFRGPRGGGPGDPQDGAFDGAPAGSATGA